MVDVVMKIGRGLSAFALGLSTSCVLAVYEDEQPQCGPNAYAADGQCWCYEYFDGDAYDLDVGCDPILTFRLTDSCDDGRDVEWRVWSLDRDWVWPEQGQVFVTAGYGVDTLQDIRCHEGELLCFGAASGQTWWELGLEGPDGPHSCSDCCVECGSFEHDLGFLTCD